MAAATTAQKSPAASNSFPGVASAVTIFSGGSQVVASGGVETNTVVSSGGTLFVQSGGLADLTTISAGGTEVVDADGTDFGPLISGGTQFVYGPPAAAVSEVPTFVRPAR